MTPQLVMPARILLADDTPDIRALLRIVLSQHEEFEVVAEAADGQEAVAMAQRHTPDLVVLDLAMPVMDGLQAIPEVRAAVPDCKIVVLSGFNAAQMANEAVSLGADLYLEKGTSPSRLVAELRRVLGLRQDGQLPTPESPVVSWTPSAIATVTHELMGPLAVIEGFGTLLERRADDLTPEQVAEQAAAIVRSARHLRTLIEAMTEARRVEIDDITVAPVTLDLVALVRDVVHELSATVPSREVRLQAPPSLLVTVDPLRVRQIVANLLANAAKFAPADQPVDIEVASTDDWFSVSVRDRGPGVAVERQAELFLRFSRLGTATKGMGLGLFISRGIAEAHGGSLVYTPAEPGSRFTLRLPHRTPVC